MNSIELGAAQLRDAERLAAKWSRLAVAAGMHGAPIVHEDTLTHAQGEVGVEALLTAYELRVVPHFRNVDPNGEPLPDVTVGFPPLRMMICVYTVAEWHRAGRSVSRALAPTLKRQADALLWCVVERPTDGADGEVRVRLAGWSMVEDVLRAPLYRPDDSSAFEHQLAESQVRPLDDLLALWHARAKAA